MRGSEVRFYADLGDMRKLLRSFNNADSFRYTETLSEVDASPASFDDAEDLMLYLRTTHPQPSNVFLVTDKAVAINTQNITMKDGSGVKIKADQLCNPDAVLIKLGGELKKILVATSVNTTAQTSKAKQTFKLLKEVVVAGSHYTDGFYVWPGALEKLKDGWRLTPDPGFSHTEDLKRPAP